LIVLKSIESLEWWLSGVVVALALVGWFGLLVAVVGGEVAGVLGALREG